MMADESKRVFVLVFTQQKTLFTNFFLKKIMPQSQNYWSKIQMCDFAALNIKKK